MPSSVINTFTYDNNKKELLVLYRSGIAYRYINVPPEVYEEMRKAFSKGVFLNTQIKGKYDFEKVE